MTIQKQTKELLQAAVDLGLEMVYKTRAQVENEIKDLLPKAKREVKFLGVCISIPNRMPQLNETLKAKAKNGVSFKFLFLKIAQGDEFNLYKQRADDESYPLTHAGTLEDEASRYIKIFEAIKRNLPPDTHGEIDIAEYKAFPYMSLIIIDDDMYVGPYLFGVNCPNMPMFKIRKKEGGIYETYLNHFNALWRYAKEEARG